MSKLLELEAITYLFPCKIVFLPKFEDLVRKILKKIPNKLFRFCKSFHKIQELPYSDTSPPPFLTPSFMGL